MGGIAVGVCSRKVARSPDSLEEGAQATRPPHDREEERPFTTFTILRPERVFPTAAGWLLRPQGWAWGIAGVWAYSEENGILGQEGTLENIFTLEQWFSKWSPGTNSTWG